MLIRKLQILTAIIYFELIYNVYTMA